MLGLITGMTGIILFGGYVLRMEGYLGTNSIFLRHVGHVSLLKKDAYLNYQQNPSKYSFDLAEQNAILEVLQSSSIKMKRLIPVVATQAMLSSGCQNFPVWVQGIRSDDMNWIYSHTEVRKQIPELARMHSGQGYWNTNNVLAGTTSPTLWRFLDKDPLDSITEDSRKTAEGILNCDDPATSGKLKHTNDLQLYSQDFYGGLGLVDTTVSGLKYSGFSLIDEVFYITTLELVQNLVKSDNIYKWALYFEDTSNLSKKILELKKSLKEKNIENIDLIPYRDARVSALYVGNMTFVFIMFLFFLILICGVVVLTVFNSLQIAALERKKDISIYKSIGFRNTIITQIFQVEYFLISLAACIISGFIGVGAAHWNNSMNFRFQLPGYSSTLQFRLEPSTDYIFFVFVFMILLIQLVSYVQIHRILQQQSADLMRFDL